MTDLNALIERLSRATGPDGNLDIDIYKASGQARAPDSSVMEFMLDHDGDALWRVKHEGQDFGSWWHVPQFSSSIDAAISLGGVCVFASDIGADGLPLVKIVTDTTTTPIIEYTGIAATLELAWCIAALSALNEADHQQNI